MADAMEVIETGSVAEKHLRVLRVDGLWDDACDRAYRDAGANGIVWRPPRRNGLTCDVFLEHRDTLRDLSVIARRPVEDSAIASLRDLSSVRALTMATNPLDLSTLHRLTKVEIDDREGLSGLCHPSLSSASVHGSRRNLSDFDGAVALNSLKLEGARGRVVDVRSDLPSLRWLMIINSGVFSLEGLRAPQLEWLSLVEMKLGPAVLDLSPLTAHTNLKRVAVGGAGTVTGVEALAQLPGLDLRLIRRIKAVVAEQ
ncbi:hypothetical protein [Blastococcus litoris]|uniref:hypothetical protein n=1 Tax=Blastococcus litoris TaxID=2171622 RepID=UPI000E308DE0|nr:hypothetical protein [Blastococcus litoris]